MPELTAWTAVGWTLVAAVCLVVLMFAFAIGLLFIRAAWRSQDPKTHPTEKEDPSA